MKKKLLHFKNNIAPIILGICFFIISTKILKQDQGVSLDAIKWVVSLTLSGIFSYLIAPQYTRTNLLILILLWLSLGAGLLQTLIILYWFISTLCLGKILLNFSITKNLEKISFTQLFVVGFASWIAIWGAIIHYPINYRWVYLLVTLIPILAELKSKSNLIIDLKLKTISMNDWIQTVPIWSWSIGLIIIGWVLRWSILPTLSSDDHASHLRLWTELLYFKEYTFDIKTQIWSAAPFTVDLLHAGLSLMAGSDARSGMNLVLTILVFLFMIRIFQILKIEVKIQWLLIILMASTPMLGNLLLTLHTEIMLSLLVLASFRLILDLEEANSETQVIALLACAAIFISIKLTGVILAGLLIIIIIFQLWKQRNKNKIFNFKLKWQGYLFLLVLALISTHSYFMSWYLTGNPVFPLYNAIFLSPFFPPINFSNPLYDKGFSLDNYINIFFETSKFFESGNYVAGWQYLFILPFSIITVFISKSSKNFKIALLIILGYGLFIFYTTQYWRYLFPVIPLAGITFAAIFTFKNKLIKILAIFTSILCIFFNLYYFTHVSWLMNYPPSIAFNNKGKTLILSKKNPVAILNKKINTSYPGAVVLYPSETPFGATLNGKPIYLNWYSPASSKSFNSITNFKDLETFLNEYKIDIIIVNMSNSKSDNAPEVILRNYIAKFGTVIDQEKSYIMYKINKMAQNYNEIFVLTNKLIESEKKFIATFKTKSLGFIQINGAKQARYNVEFKCPSNTGSFIAQINWNLGSPYYRFVNCSIDTIKFSEAIPVPAHVTYAEVFITSRETPLIYLNSISVETQ